MRICLFGGTFDPPHIGHLLIAQTVCEEESFDKTGEILKEKYFSYSHINGYDVLSEIKVINIQEDHSTNLKFENIELDTGVEDKLFHEMYLKRLPQ